jgi:competence protein ComEC
MSALPPIVFLLFLGWHELSLLPDGRTHIYFLDVGQGDGALVVTPTGKAVVIDGGPDTRMLEHLGTYRPFFSRRIDMLVLSHPHLDHLASFPDMLRRYEVKTVVLSGVPAGLPRYREMLGLMRAQGTRVVSPSATGLIDFGDGVQMEILWPSATMLAQHPDDINDTSVVVRVSAGSGSALFTGDIEDDAEQRMVAAKIDVRADILKVAHHGSNSSSSTGFIVAVSPAMAVMSVGKDNTFRHPRPEIVRRYESLHIPIRRTDLEGTIEVVWD